MALEILDDKPGAEIGMDSGAIAPVAGFYTLAAARELLAPGPGGCALAECGHRGEAIVKAAMCTARIQSYFHRWPTPAMVAAWCRQSAGEPQESPGVALASVIPAS